MNLLDGKRTVAIKTYLNECGLWYLAESLYKKLISEGHVVYFIPKSRYTYDGSTLYREYKQPEDKTKLSSLKILNMDKDKDISYQILNHCEKNKIDTIISMETFMQKSSWISFLKNKKNISIIDVPMIEWVSEPALNGKSYRIFDEVWCLTDFTFSKFLENKYDKIKRIEWDYVDRSLFNLKEPSDLTNDMLWLMDAKYKFLHNASTSESFSHKNTEEVIKAFNLLNRDDSRLLVTGFFNNKQFEQILSKNKNIKLMNKLVDRKELSNIYKISDVIIAPSIKEGLGMSFYEAKACGKKIITTNYEPMSSVGADFLCKPYRIKNDGSLIPRAEVLSVEILDKLKIITG